LEKSRIYKLYEQSRLTKKVVIKPLARDAWDFFIKTFSAAGIYGLASAKNSSLVWSAAVLACLFLGLTVRTVVHEIIHPRSTFNRRYLLFETNPRFIRIRSIFELFRRTLYFVTGFAFASYAFHRLYPDAFSILEPQVPLFVVHFESAISMTCPATDPISYATLLGSIFHIVRNICCFSIIILFVNLITSSFSMSDFKNFRRRKANLNSGRIAIGIESKQDLEDLVKDIAQHCFEGAEKKIALDSNLTTQLHADQMEIAELQFRVEEALECKLSPKDFDSAKTIRELTDLLWAYIQKQKTEPMFPVIAKQLKNNDYSTKTSADKVEGPSQCGGS
jgi:acyl carrier protein